MMRTAVGDVISVHAREHDVADAPVCYRLQRHKQHPVLTPM